MAMLFEAMLKSSIITSFALLSQGISSRIVGLEWQVRPHSRLAPSPNSANVTS